MKNQRTTADSTELMDFLYTRIIFIETHNGDRISKVYIHKSHDIYIYIFFQVNKPAHYYIFSNDFIIEPPSFRTKFKKKIYPENPLAIQKPIVKKNSSFAHRIGFTPIYIYRKLRSPSRVARKKARETGRSLSRFRNASRSTLLLFLLSGI